MQTLRFSDFIRRTCPFSMQRAHASILLALCFTLFGGLACDENAPTETRAPDGPTDIGSDGDEPEVLGDVSAMAIALPVDQSVATTAPAPAFRIRQTGTGPNGIFQIARTGNTQTALQGLTNGRGRAGFFQLTNNLNTQSALEAVTSGAGRAGFFRVLNAANTQAALEVTTAGTGRAGMFTISHTTSTSPVVNAVHAGLGDAGSFQTTNASNTSTALRASASSSGPAFVASQSGSGGGGFFFVGSRGGSNRPALHVQSESSGFGLLVQDLRFGGAFHAQGFSQFDGNVTINGTLTKTAGSFKIDHPLDPEHKYLSHSFVESPDMMNVYNGNATLDANGRATVELPEYFEALNRDFRYQLTAIGAPGPNLYVAEGVKQNRFRIAGGRPYASVSWQVTGVRQDAYANEHRIKVEEDKPPAEGNLVARR